LRLLGKGWRLISYPTQFTKGAIHVTLGEGTQALQPDIFRRPNAQRGNCL